MSKILRNRVAAVVSAALVLVALGYGAGLATAASTPTAVGVCVTKKNVVVSATHRSRCPLGTHKISVSVRGPRGATGPTGATGATGPTGPAGPPGTTALGTGTDFTSGGSESPNCILGVITLSANGFAIGVPARGQLLPINQNQALFSLLGTRFGGNGTTNFQLPDLRSAAPNGLVYGICTTGIFPSRF